MVLLSFYVLTVHRSFLLPSISGAGEMRLKLPGDTLISVSSLRGEKMRDSGGFARGD